MYNWYHAYSRGLCVPCNTIRAWNDGCAVKMARTIYEERDFASVPILADALEDAGCESAAILSHLRSDSPHVRGCWAVDLILGKS